MNVFKRLFAGPDEAAKIVDGVTSGIDKIWFTNEERAEFSLKAGDWYIRWLEATQNAAVARRLIAVLVVGTFILLSLVGCALYPLDQNYAEFIFKVLADVYLQPFSIIIGFYFLTHTVREFKKTKQDK